jgi:hypothetical protein
MFGRIKFAQFGVAALAIAALPALAQYPGQISQKDKGVPTLRSVIVVEWTGDLTKPHASRVIPISVWDGNELQDGGIYLPRPVPLALDPDVEYDLQTGGKNVALFDIESASQQQGTWIGFGLWRAMPKGPSPAELAKMHASVKIDEDDSYSDKPILHRKAHASDSGSGDPAGSGDKNAPPDSDRPTLHRGNDSDGDSTADSGNPHDAPDPDRPRLHAETDPKPGDSGKPKFQRAPEDDEANVRSVDSSNDPDRPKLERGAVAKYGAAVTPTLVGMPPEMNQQVGVSDAKSVKDHPWDFAWSDPDDQRKMKEALEDEARKALGLVPPPAPPAPKKTATTTARRNIAPPPPPAPIPLIDEQFHVFELSYGGGATMVFSAHTDGTAPGENGTQHFVTLIAQPDLYGGVVILIKNVTDAAHLDVKPRMRLVDAVDALGDNRGELVFELRGQSQRQFALYRVLRGTATQIFATTSTFFGTAGE